ncbi:hypothetical protein ASF61_17040 [Duganella sp. Leaf126]|uniref:hypothetical protein n=1 Tax=Duganella sp. Leaf126 TaxID=1736266 RepID=UPI000700DAFE|nr:hypothetical protein [Duganella sp. Leaf126]KQQ32037.1 hypothetical protein ASF61_17040 [Duganella sp. Leaf126]
MTLEHRDDDFWVDFRTFNGFFDPSRWQETKAAKDHIDEFGQAIAERDLYFTRTLGLGSNERLKVSRASMEAMVKVFFLENPAGRELGDGLIEERQQHLARALQRVAVQVKIASEPPVVSDGISDGI